MQEQALKVCEMCEEKEILILPNWIRRKANLRADKLSRSFDIVYQQISHIVFRRKMGCVQFRPVCVTVQRKVLQFKSNDWCQTQVELNAFCQRWTFGTNWWVPPSKKLCRVVDKLVLERDNGTLIVPMWKLAHLGRKLYRYSNQAGTSLQSDHFFFPSQLFDRREKAPSFIKISHLVTLLLEGEQQVCYGKFVGHMLILIFIH